VKKIAVGDIGEFWYGDYKEPFEQLEGAVPGYPVGVLLKDDDGKLLCAYCGKTYDSLGKHVSTTHGLPPKDFKREIGLLQKSSLRSERARLRSSARAAQMVDSTGRPSILKHLAKAHEARRASYGPNKPMRTPEVLNRTGRCYSQLLAVGRAILREDGRVSGRTLRKRGINETAVLAFWDSLDDFRRAVGDSYRPPRRGWTDQQLIAALRALAAKIGRTPRLSDLSRYGLPVENTFRKHFGSYAEACRRAGLDPNLPHAVTTEGFVEFLVAYATLGNIRKASQLTGVAEKRAVALFASLGAPFAPNTPAGRDSAARRAWAAEMARRLAGTAPESVAA
jgi:hypothetical protein